MGQDPANKPNKSKKSKKSTKPKKSLNAENAAPKPVEPGVAARRLALTALAEIDDGGYANVILGPLLDDSGLAERDRALVAELVYGTTRMRRALDFVIDRHVLEAPDRSGRAALRIGAYQIHYLRVPAHAAVSATVAASPKRLRGFVNAVLRKLSAEAPPTWPDLATELSYPTWIVDLLTEELGADATEQTLRRMNQAATVDTRPDGYVQNRASQWVSELVDAQPGELVIDLCAAPGGKATAIAMTGAGVVAADSNPKRARTIAENVSRLSDVEGRGPVGVVVADGTNAPFRPGSADRVVVDAPCSGLGVLQRRPDARWRIDEPAIERLALLQQELLSTAVALCRPGGMVIYSVCTLSRRETLGVAEHLTSIHPELLAMAPPEAPWQPIGTGGLLLPHVGQSVGMAFFAWRKALGE